MTGRKAISLKQSKQEYERPETSSDSRLRSLIWNVVAFIFGWTLFFYWWSIVLEATTSATFIDIFAGLLFILAVLFILSWFWIAHNLRLARRGSRSDGDTDIPETDRSELPGGPSPIGDLEALRASAVVVVDSEEDGSGKFYSGEGGRVA